MNSELAEIRRGVRACNQFLDGHDGRGAMFEEFCNSGLVDVEQVAASGVLRSRIFEFDWGFVAESTDDEHGWNCSLYVQHVWRTGTVEWWDAFEAGHQRLVQSHLSEVGCDHQGGDARSGLQFVSGSHAFCAATYRSGCRDGLCPRSWLGTRLLPVLWPQVLRHTLEPVLETSAFLRAPRRARPGTSLMSRQV